ncbi:MAG TPA: hypothetical protein VFF12_00900 [Myxococcaceae bacterium]|nr:hypothetical protein [Myxococcaceae bacterium]
MNREFPFIVLDEGAAHTFAPLPSAFLIRRDTPALFATEDPLRVSGTNTNAITRRERMKEDMLREAQVVRRAMVSIAAAISVVTLYVDSRDTVGNAPTCVGACLTNWPVFAAGNGPLPTGIDPSKLTSFTRPDGIVQSAFDGHPLYYFAHDAAPGDVLGRGGLQGAFDTFNPTAL